jgi:hypothetical protein
MLLRREGKEEGNTFIAVWEPVRETPLIDRVELAPCVSEASGAAEVMSLRVYRGDRVDIVALAPQAGLEYRIDSDLRSDAAVAILTREGENGVRAFAAGGSALADERTGKSWKVPRAIAGRIRLMDLSRKMIIVEVPDRVVQTEELVGRWVRISNEDHSCMYRIAKALAMDDGLMLELGGSDLFTGRIRIESIDPQTSSVTTVTRVLYPHNVAGMSLVTEDLRHGARIESMQDGVIRLKGVGSASTFWRLLEKAIGKDAWIVDFCYEDYVEVEGYLLDVQG